MHQIIVSLIQLILDCVCNIIVLHTTQNYWRLSAVKININSIIINIVSLALFVIQLTYSLLLTTNLKPGIIVLALITEHYIILNKC